MEMIKLKNKDKLFTHFSFSCYRYAPESFKLSFKGKNVQLSHEEISSMGSALICGGKQELLKLIKQWVRNKSGFRKLVSKRYLAIVSKDELNYYFVRIPVNRYDITEKLYSFKALKSSINENKIRITVTTSELDGLYKPTNIRKDQQNIQLSNKVKFVLG